MAEPVSQVIFKHYISALLFRNLASPFLRSPRRTHCATLRIDLLCFPKNGSYPSFHQAFKIPFHYRNPVLKINTILHILYSLPHQQNILSKVANNRQLNQHISICWLSCLLYREIFAGKKFREIKDFVSEKYSRKINFSNLLKEF